MLRRRIERQLVVGVEVQPSRRDVRAQRPAVAPLPRVRTALEGERLGQIQLAFVLEPVREPRRLDVATEFLRGRAPEVDVTELRTGRAGPSSVIPRTDDEIVQMLRVILLEQLV